MAYVILAFKARRRKLSVVGYLSLVTSGKDRVIASDPEGDAKRWEELQSTMARLRESDKAAGRAEHPPQ
jgi:hypothetical protein